MKLFGKIIPLFVLALISCQVVQNEATNKNLASDIQKNENMKIVLEKANAILKTGFNAGDGYGEVWIRDLNTFIELSCDVVDRNEIRQHLLTFFKFQRDDGNIIDGYIPRTKASVDYDFIHSDLAPEYAGHKNTVETDQESSLIQAVWKYINATGNFSILQEEIDGKSVLLRLEWAMGFLLNERFSDKYGLLWGATTADWGDVQPEHDWGVVLDENTHYAIDIYDNAMFVIAINNFIDLAKNDEEKIKKWTKIRDDLKSNIRTHLWDAKSQKYIPHVYLEDSPFPTDFNENELHYHGGTATAIEADLLSKNEIAVVNLQMLQNVQDAGAGSIGLTVYPPYPQGFFKNKGMGPYGYQNGGDWTWFGGRMIQQLIRNGFVEEAVAELEPMLQRVLDNDGFYEWYTVDNKPKGSGTFRGSAGVLGKAIKMLYVWAEENK
jgi:GH15 family glucan-1,4-alpha-glucosidase